MPDTNIERTIFKIELDGSAYIQGADKLTASTNKFAAEQEKTNLALKKSEERLKQQSLYLQDTKKWVDESIGKNKEYQIQQQKQYQDALADNKKLTDAVNKNRQAYDQATKSADNFAKVSAKASNLQNFTSGISKAFNGLSDLAFLIPGVGAGIVGLISGISASLSKLATAESTFEQATKLVNEGLKASANASAEAGTSVDIMKIKFDLARQGLLSKKEVLDEYNNTLGKTLGVTKSFNEAEETTIKNAEAYITIVGLKARAQAIANLRIKESEKALTADLEDNRSTAAKLGTFLFFNDKGSNQAFLDQVEKDKQRFAGNVKNEANEKIKILNKEEIHVQEELALAKLAFINKPKSFDKATKKSNTEILNIYEQELQKLKADIAKLDEKGFTSEATIKKALEEDFAKRQQFFEQAAKKGQLTSDQLTRLTKLLKQDFDKTFSLASKAFQESKVAYLEKINDEIIAIQKEENLKRIASIKDGFEKERQTIIAETQNTISAAQRARDKQILDANKSAAAHGLTESDIKPFTDSIKNNFFKLIDDLGIIQSQKLQQLSFDTFEKLDSVAKEIFERQDSNLSVITSLEIQKQAELLRAGLISYKQYQDAITKIAKDASNQRFEDESQKLNSLILRRQNELFSGTVVGKLTDDQQTQLRNEIADLNKQLADLQKANATGSVDKPGKKGKTDSIAAYAEAIGAVVDSVIQFWQAANDAESKALDRSIALQEKRVTAAQRIADRGNAQYLKAEEDRLTQLNVRRENAARKQLGIDAALQASQILVGITGAISKIAGKSFGAETIAEIAIIIGALATGYGLVKSLQGNQPKLFTGTKYLTRNGAPSGKDTIPVMANEGEAVIPTTTNKKYHPTIAAIYDGTIPADHMNNFVKNYHQIKRAPHPNYDRIKDAAELHIGMDGRMTVLLTEQNRKIEENNDLQRQTLRAMKSMSVSANIDRNGVAIMVNEYVDKMKIDRRV